MYGIDLIFILIQHNFAFQILKGELLTMSGMYHLRRGAVSTSPYINGFEFTTELKDQHYF